MSIQTKHTPAGLRFDVLYRDPSGRQHRKRFTNRREAEQHEREQRVDVARGTYVDRRDRKTVADACTAYIAMKVDSGVRESTSERMSSLVANHVAGTPLGATRVVRVRPTDVRIWYAGVSRALAPSTARYALRFVRAAFQTVLIDGGIASNPAAADALRFPRGHGTDEPERLVPLTIEQVHALSDAVPERCRAMVLVQAGTGLRMSELLALTTDDVDMLRRSLRVSAQLRKGQRVPPKSGHAYRDVPLMSWVVDALSEHLARRPATGDPAFLFRSTRDTPMHQQTYGDVLERGVRDAGLPVGTTSHDLRHHFASVLLAQGVAPIVVARLLGHADATLVHRTYGHLMPDDDDVRRATLETAWRARAAAEQQPEQPAAPTPTLRRPTALPV